MYRCISFDVDDTLWNFTTMMQAGIKAVVPMMQADGAPEVTDDTIYDRYYPACETHDPAQMHWTELRRRIFRDILADHDHADPEAASQTMIAEYLRVWKGSMVFFPGAKALLDTLHGQYKLAWTTNGNFGPETGNMTQYFDVVAMPHLVGTSKPDPGFIQYVADQAGCTPEEILHVGDSLRSDVGGANAAGATSVWFNPNHLENTTDQTPDHEIHALKDVLPLLA